MDLAQAKQLQDLANLGCNAHNTAPKYSVNIITNNETQHLPADAHDEGNLRLGLNVEVTMVACLSLQLDGLLLLLAELLDVLLGLLEDDRAALLCSLDAELSLIIGATKTVK